MNVLMVVLRFIHIFSGIFWVGVAFFNIGFLQPAVQGAGPDGQKVMQFLSQKTRFLLATYTAATLTLLSGLIMYIYLFGLSVETLSNPYGLTLTIGGLSGLVAWVIAVILIKQIFDRMGALGQAIAALGGPPTPEQGAELMALRTRLGTIGRVALVFLALAVIAMSTAQYL